ncbi:MAG: pyridoxal phosphate-dependent aminotransferase [Deltaproteobacteria bacterium]|nr:pyridoxal phosphate-dependent aminotransferase [Deltaproteobacteria bacterium]
MTPVSSRSRDITPFIVMDVLERAKELEKEGREIIHLEVGEPDFPTPLPISEAAIDAIKREETHYTHSLGLLELREAICEHYFKKYRVNITPDRVVVTSGTSPALFMIYSAALEAGDKIILSNPHYPCYPNFALFLKAAPCFVDVYEEDGFQYRPSEIKKKITPKTEAILINSPSNPTGNLLSPERMAEIADLGPYIISDEIYHGLVYGEKEHSILEYTDRAFVVNGFSKLHAMTGWRLGYMIAPPEFIRPVQKIQQNFYISASSIAQWAGIAALTKADKDIEKMRSVYNERRTYMIARLKKMGFNIPVEPKGAFYVFVNAKHISLDSYRLSFDILERAGVGVTPGIDFGANGEGYLRFSYANSIENITEGLNRIERYLKER